jgi:hypothetical protein
MERLSVVLATMAAIVTTMAAPIAVTTMVENNNE